MAEKTPRKVLIVEDNALNMRLFSDLLEASGYETLQCVDGAKAVGIALEETPDLIIMDIQHIYSIIINLIKYLYDYY